LEGQVEDDIPLTLGEIVRSSDRADRSTLVVYKSALAAVRSKDASPTEHLSVIYVLNVLFAVALGISGLAWLAAYTEHFTTLQSLLGLGGVFVWCTFLSNLIPDARKEMFRTFVDRAMGTWPMIVTLFFIAVIFAWFPLHRAAVVFVDRSGTTARIVSAWEVREDDTLGKKLATDVLLPNGTLRLTIPASLYSRRYRILASGTPAIDRDIKFLGRLHVSVPSDFQRTPAVLLHLTLDDTRNIDPAGTQLVIYLWRSGKIIQKAQFDGYDGRSIWFGCDSSVPIPIALKAHWPSAVADSWGTTASAAESSVLRRGDAVSAKLTHGTSDCIALLPHTVIQPLQFPEGTVAEITIPPCQIK
jgi:hypothetical protein